MQKLPLTLKTPRDAASEEVFPSHTLWYRAAALEEQGQLDDAEQVYRQLTVALQHESGLAQAEALCRLGSCRQRLSRLVDSATAYEASRCFITLCLTSTTRQHSNS